MTNLIESIKTGFASKKVLIIGDIVADQYLNGTISRVSREAPVFILRHDETTTLPGAAANAAANVASLGGTPILIGAIGSDLNGELLRGSLSTRGVDLSSVVIGDSIKTTTKLRVLAGGQHAVHQQVIRIDYENRSEFPADVQQKMIENIAAADVSADAIIISDYNYGVADSTVFAAAMECSRKRGIPLVVDSRFRLAEFQGATAATPNQEEAEQLLGINYDSRSVEELRERFGYEALLITNGNKGMRLYESGRPFSQIDAVGSLDPVDVTGAGDTVIAAFALGLASGISFVDSARLANHAGGLVVMKKGTATVSTTELINSIENEAKARASNPNV